MGDERVRGGGERTSGGGEVEVVEIKWPVN